MITKRNIAFSPPDITQEEIDEVVDSLKSGWITTGPKTKLFENQIANYCNTSKAVALNSATAAMELTLRLLGIGPGDEVITSAYTYSASASVIHHVGAKIVLVDTAKNSFEMDYEKLGQAITERTKAIIPVDIAGIMCDYDKIYEVVENKKVLFNPSTELQKAFSRVIVVADAAHSFGATYQGRQSGEVADFSSFSFHAVKNLTTAEGGAVTWKDIDGFDNEEIYNQFMLLSLHGQSKD
ncbi:MAG: DegT/DnrJ/EryC1/StrS aminotransferase family protein, partial [Tissierellia bacterium]|nr:DegT/DnrJ/EryC1/StrS aminotransferase family protein [Tissierellia bacterium]